MTIISFAAVFAGLGVGISQRDYQSSLILVIGVFAGFWLKQAGSQMWRKPGESLIAAANGTYATYASHHTVLGFNKQGQIFEIRSFDPGLKSISPGEIKDVLATPPMAAPPAYDKEFDGQMILGYLAGPEFKLEFIFTPTTAASDLTLDHYNILYPRGMETPGREW